MSDGEKKHMHDSKRTIKSGLARGIAGAVRQADALIRARTRTVLMVEAMVAALTMVFLATPYALADTSAFEVDNAFQALNDIVTYLLLPVGIAWASWQLVYIAVVCGLIGIDPLNLLGGNLDQDHVWGEVRNRFRNFAYGIAWVAGIWILFEFVLFLVANLSNVISDNFG